MTEHADTYQAACKRCDEAYEALIAACLPVATLAYVLQSYPDKIAIVGIPRALGNVNATVNFDGSTWPTASTINDALAEFHAALGARQTAWLNVQIAGENHGLQPPSRDEWERLKSELRGRATRPPRR